MQSDGEEEGGVALSKGGVGKEKKGIATGRVREGGRRNSANGA